MGALLASKLLLVATAALWNTTRITFVPRLVSLALPPSPAAAPASPWRPSNVCQRVLKTPVISGQLRAQSR